MRIRWNNKYPSSYREEPPPQPEAEPEICLYRVRTRSLLRKYAVLSVETGRLPAVVGREFFRANLTSYPQHSFEDAVIFVHDVERCLERLEPFSRQLIALIAIEDFTEDEAAHVLRCPLRNIERRLPEALDRISDDFLRVGLLRPSGCQEAKKPCVAVSCW